jgi:hypothetical protein
MEITEEKSQLESILRGFAEMEVGYYIPHEAMKAWLLSLGAEHELSVPKCVCCESHDEPSEHGRRNGRAGL